MHSLFMQCHNYFHPVFILGVSLKSSPVLPKDIPKILRVLMCGLCGGQAMWEHHVVTSEPLSVIMSVNKLLNCFWSESCAYVHIY